jgi:hypothetical protein
MHINLTLGSDLDSAQLMGLFTWLEETYHQVNITITVPEFIDEGVTTAATETGRRLVALINEAEANDQLKSTAQAVTDEDDTYRMCKCSHTSRVHYVGETLGCIIDGCSCERFDQVEVDWLSDGVTGL